ncbi:hypothetical protein CBM2626_B60068 [Cupriavidus taiwanensis]|nr:hypothetical protein CBM2626_B60068 [Cupriavidus taiwanensis]
MMSETTRNVQPVTANLGKDGAGELVPSRYAVRVGDVDVVLISDGILPLPTSTMSTNVSQRTATPGAMAASCNATPSTGR